MKYVEYQCKPEASEYEKLWFSDEYFDLFTWKISKKRIHASQLCYEKATCERALTEAEGQVIGIHKSTPARTQQTETAQRFCSLEAASQTL